MDDQFKMTEEEENEIIVDTIKTEDEFSMNEQIEVTTEPIEETIEEIRPQNVYIKVKFPKSATPVDCVSAITNCSDKIVASNKQLALLQNRFYFIPVDCDSTIDSDQYSILKVYSEFADCIDVRYVKDGVACVMPLKHNFKIREGMVLAILF